jgi:transposase-like protein
MRLRIARSRGKSFLLSGLKRFQRRAEEVSLLIREAFLRGISTRRVGRAATLTGETVSAQAVSKLTRDLDEAVREFHQARLSDDDAYLFLDGVRLRVRRPAGRKQVQMLVACGVRQDGSRHLLAFLRSQGKSQADWKGLLQDLYRRGLEGKQLALIVTDGCPDLSAAIRTVYPRVPHQRCWLHKMRNLLEKSRKSDTTKSSEELRPSIWQRAGPRPKPHSPGALAESLPGDDPAAGARSTGTVVLLCLSPTPVAETAHHQCDRALFRRSTEKDPAHGVFLERRKCGSHHLLHLPAL